MNPCNRHNPSTGHAQKQFSLTVAHEVHIEMHAQEYATVSNIMAWHAAAAHAHVQLARSIPTAMSLCLSEVGDTGG